MTFGKFERKIPTRFDGVLRVLSIRMDISEIEKVDPSYKINSIIPPTATPSPYKSVCKAILDANVVCVVVIDS